MNGNTNGNGNGKRKFAMLYEDEFPLIFGQELALSRCALVAYIALRVRCNPGASFWTDAQTLFLKMQGTGYDKCTVARAVTELCRKGLVRRDGKTHQVRYTVLPVQVIDENVTNFSKVIDENVQVIDENVNRPPRIARREAASRPPNKQNKQKRKQTQKQTSAQARGGNGGGDEISTALTKDHGHQVLMAWNAIYADLDREAQAMTQDRLKAVNRLYRALCPKFWETPEKFLDDFQEVVKWSITQEFLNPKGHPQEWLDLDWMLDLEHFVKLNEGKYGKILDRRMGSRS